MLQWENDLKLCGTELFFDSRQRRGLCFVSHAHTDHLPSNEVHDCSIATAPTIALAEYRNRGGKTIPLEYGADHEAYADTCIRLLPAGHVLGSAMLHVTRPEGTLLYTGDFKLRPSVTTGPAEIQQADVLVMESTYGLPMFRFPSWRQVADELVERVMKGIRAGRQPIVMGYTLGKAQEITRILTDANVPVTCHGAVYAINQIYRELGVPLGEFRRYRYEDFHGPGALELADRGALIAPPNVARAPFTTRFDNPLRIMLSGWGLLKNSQYRYGVDHVLPLSDHADFDELLELIDRVRPKKIFTHHGYEQFADYLRVRGHDATLARPSNQLVLFD